MSVLGHQPLVGAGLAPCALSLCLVLQRKVAGKISQWYGNTPNLSYFVGQIFQICHFWQVEKLPYKLNLCDFALSY